MSTKFDAIIEAVRYKNGQITLVRAYEKRGAAFSDRILLDRKELLERMKSGKQLSTGARRELWANSFEEGKPIQLLNRDGKDVIATHEQAEHDELEQAPVF